MRLTARSSDYLTPPWGFKYQPPFVNLCIAVETALAPRDLLERAQEVELQLGRDRAHEKRNGPRTADIDIIAYDDLTLDELGLTLPHPRLFERAFVLVPLAEIAPDRDHCRAARRRCASRPSTPPASNAWRRAGARGQVICFTGMAAPR